MEGHGRSRKVKEGQGRSRKVKEGQGRSENGDFGLITLDFLVHVLVLHHVMQFLNDRLFRNQPDVT